MDAGVTGRIGLAAAVAACALAASTALVLLAETADSRAPGDDLKPDLFVQRPTELYLAQGGKEVRLRVSNTVANRGTGPLEMESGGDAPECVHPTAPEGRRTLQTVYEDSDDPGSPGYFIRGEDEGFSQTAVGCSRYHEAHDHWHFDNFARYTLLDDRTGDDVGGSRKVSFCVIDTGQPYPDLNGSPSDGYYPQDPGSEFPTCSETSIDGLSVGWEDTYGASLPGQGIRVTGLSRGYYCLVLETDPPGPGIPEGVLDESDEENNARTIRLRMRPRALFVKRLGSDCKTL